MARVRGFLKPESQKVWSSGTVDVDEMVEIVCNLYEMEGISKVTSHISARHKPSTSQYIWNFRTLQRKMQGRCSASLILIGMESWTKMSSLKAAWRFFVNRSDHKFSVRRSDDWFSYLCFQDSNLQDLLNGSAEWTKKSMWMWSLRKVSVQTNEIKDLKKAVIQKWWPGFSSLKLAS